MNKKFLYRALSVLFALCLWQIAALCVHADFLLASPLQVIARCFTLFTDSDFLPTLLFSFLRISSGFLLAFVGGIFCAVVAARFRWAEYLLQPFVVAVKTVPIASFIILCLLWLDFNQLTVFIAALIAFPVLYSNVLHGIQSADVRLVEVADLYRVPFARRLLYIYLPAVKSHLLSACNVAIGTAWKAGVAAEVIGVVKGSIGGKLYDAKIYFQNADLLAWTIIIIAVGAISEKIMSCVIRLLYGRIEKL